MPRPPRFGGGQNTAHTSTADGRPITTTNPSGITGRTVFRHQRWISEQAGSAAQLGVGRPALLEGRHRIEFAVRDDGFREAVEAVGRTALDNGPATERAPGKQ